MNHFLNNRNKHTNIILPILLSGFLVLSVSLSLLFLIHEAEHECNEEHCHICAMMQSASCNIQSLSHIADVHMFSLVTIPLRFGIADITTGHFCDNTLVGKKIRLND